MVKGRKKAGDLFRESTPLFGRKTSFAEAYPQIEDIEVEVEETGRGVESWSRSRRYTKEYLPGEFVNCSNPMCYGAGFQLGLYLHGMVSGKKTELEESALCSGNEGSPQGRRIYRKCLNLFKLRAVIECLPLQAGEHSRKYSGWQPASADLILTWLPHGNGHRRLASH